MRPRRRGADTYDSALPPACPLFDSPIPGPADRERLGRQAAKVLGFALGAGWVTLRQISIVTGAPEASVSARLRGLRKDGFTVERRKGSLSFWEYRVAIGGGNQA